MLKTMLAKIIDIKNFFNPPKVAPKYTDLSVNLNSAIRVDASLLLAYDEHISAPLPVNVLAYDLAIGSIHKETLWGLDRYVLVPQQRMPETDYSISLDRMEGTKATTLWFQVDVFYPGTTSEWDEHIGSLTHSDVPFETDTPYVQVYYSNNITVTPIDGKPEFYHIQHETVWKRTTVGDIVELFKVRIADERVEYWLGYELSPANVTIVY